MKVILAEKPSVARDIASVVGAGEKKRGYFQGNGYAVTYAFGHLVTIAEPEDMNSDWGSPWRLEQLPMIPVDWKCRIAQKAEEQFNVIKQLLHHPACESVICACDAGREGEHIFRLIYNLSGCTRPVERLWISSLTAEAIEDGLKNLRPASQFDNLAAAASARSHADWLVGLNFTRAYTAMNRQLCTIGRVQTPTLSLIVERQKAIDSFQAANFFEVAVVFEPGFVARYVTPGEDPQTRLPDKPVAQAIVDSLTGKSGGVVDSVKTTEKKVKAPPLYDLLTLQKEANKRFGYTAKETLDIAQNLYEEHKLITYPRTESRHISTDMVKDLPAVITAALKAPSCQQAVVTALAAQSIKPGSVTADLLRGRLTKSYMDDNKLTDHHAIIPTHKVPPPGLPERQTNIYNLVAMRFLSIFLPPEVSDETTAFIGIGEHSFRARGVVIKDPGWTIVEPRVNPVAEKRKKEKDASDESQQLPPLVKGQHVPKRKVELKERKTSAPKPYDDATLLTAMKNAGQELDDEDLSIYMKQRGLGTPATRAAIIERLLQTGYIERNKKTLIPTEKGKALIEQVHCDLKDVKLTASWEQGLCDMQEGKLALAKFEADIADFVRNLLPSVTADGGVRRVPAEGDIGPCPKCPQGFVRFTPKGAGCTRWKDGCTFSIWREQYGKELKDVHIEELIAHGRTSMIKGFKKKDGTGKYDARLVLNEEFKVRLAFDNEEGGGLGICPRCKLAVVRLNSKGAGCSRWREGCTFFLWRQQYRQDITDEQMKELIEKGRTEIIKGFKRKDGNGTYDARLVLSDDCKVTLEFDKAVRCAVESPATRGGTPGKG